MRNCLLIIFFTCLSSIYSFANEDSTANRIGLATGVNGSWWKYNRGTGEGWDRSDFVLHYNFDLNYSRKIKKYELGLNLSYGALNETHIESYNDVPSKRSREIISEGFVQFYGLGIEVSNRLLDYKKYNLSAGVGAGVFQVNTLYADKDRFGTKVYWNAFVKHQILIKKDYYFSFKMEYEKKHVFVVDAIEGEHHEIIRLGLGIGIDKYF